MAAWSIGGVMAFAGAMAYAELSALRPRAGGEYVYLREAFGPLAAFLTGWTSFVAGFSGAIAASAVALASYLSRFVPVAGDLTPLLIIPLGPLDLVVSPQALVAVSVIAALSGVHILGLGPGRVVQNLLAGLKVAILVGFVVLGFAIGDGSSAHFAEGGQVVPSLWVLALIPVMFSYAGWNAATYVAEEIREPGRNVPLALGLGTVTVVVIYLALNLLYVYALPISEFATIDARIVDAASEQLFGPLVAGPLAAASVVMIAASISAMILAGPRVYYAMARDGQFPAIAAYVHPRFRTPVVAIVAQSVWAGLLVFSGRFDQLAEYTGFAVVLFTGIAVASLFVLRRLPSAMSIIGGFQNTKSLPPYGEPSSSMTSNGMPTNSSACSPGFAIVAEQRMNCGELPKAAQSLRSRRRTLATWDPNTPRYTWASSITTKRSPRRN